MSSPPVDSCCDWGIQIPPHARNAFAAGVIDYEYSAPVHHNSNQPHQMSTLGRSSDMTQTTSFVGECVPMNAGVARQEFSSPLLHQRLDSRATIPSIGPRTCYTDDNTSYTDYNGSSYDENHSFRDGYSQRMFPVGPAPNSQPFVPNDYVYEMTANMMGQGMFMPLSTRINSHRGTNQYGHVQAANTMGTSGLMCLSTQNVRYERMNDGVRHSNFHRAPLAPAMAACTRQPVYDCGETINSIGYGNNHTTAAAFNQNVPVVSEYTDGRVRSAHYSLSSHDSSANPNGSWYSQIGWPNHPQSYTSNLGCSSFSNHGHGCGEREMPLFLQQQYSDLNALHQLPSNHFPLNPSQGTTYINNVTIVGASRPSDATEVQPGMCETKQSMHEVHGSAPSKPASGEWVNSSERLDDSDTGKYISEKEAEKAMQNMYQRGGKLVSQYTYRSNPKYQHANWRCKCDDCGFKIRVVGAVGGKWRIQIMAGKPVHSHVEDTADIPFYIREEVQNVLEKSSRLTSMQPMTIFCHLCDIYLTEPFVQSDKKEWMCSVISDMVHNRRKKENGTLMNTNFDFEKWKFSKTLRLPREYVPRNDFKTKEELTAALGLSSPHEMVELPITPDIIAVLKREGGKT